MILMIYSPFDGHGSTRVLVDTALAVAQLYSFDAYGNALGFNPADALTEFLYSGEQFDSKIGQQYLRAIYYDPATSRFNRLDPFFGNLNDPKSLYKYLYTHADPMNGIDPTGHFGMALGIGGMLAIGIGCIAASFFYGAADNYDAASASLAKPGFSFDDYNYYMSWGSRYEGVGKLLSTVAFVIGAAPLSAYLYGGTSTVVGSLGGNLAYKVAISSILVGITDKIALDSILYVSGVNTNTFSDYYDHPFWSGADFLISIITAGIANGFDDVIKSVKTAKSTGMIPHSPDNVQARTWYLAEEAQIGEKVKEIVPLKSRAYAAFEMRNKIRTETRDLMSDRRLAEKLAIKEPNLTWEQVVQKALDAGCQGDDVWRYVIDHSMLSRPSVNALLGLTPK
jgi:RHS repeat-associated protein